MDGAAPEDLRADLRDDTSRAVPAAPEGRGDRLLAALHSHASGQGPVTTANTQQSGPVHSGSLHSRSQQSGAATTEVARLQSAGWAPNWWFWTIATAIPLTSGLAWIYLAWRTRRTSFLADALVFFCWPLVGVAGVAALASLALATNTLLSVRFNDHQDFADHVEDLRAYHDDYQLQLSPMELGQMDQLQQAYDDAQQEMVGRAEGLAEPAALLLLLTWGAMWVTSVFHAHLSWYALLAYRPPRDRRAGRPSRRKHKWCFLLWAALGLFGAHRFYLGRWMSGLLYMLSLGGLGVGWAMDIFFLRSMVATANRTGVEAGDDLAPWAKDSTRLGLVDFLMRLAFFLVAPGLFAWLCILLNQIELLIVLVFTIVFCGLLGNVKQWLGRLEILGKAPMLQPVISVISQLYAFYYENPPRAFLCYVFAPLLAPIPLLTSPTARREGQLYFRFLLTILGAVVVNELRVVSTTYRYHSWSSIALWVAAHLMIATAVTGFILIPIITTTFALNLSGRSTRLKFMSAMAIIVTFVVGVVTAGYTHVNKQPTRVSYMLLRSKLRDPEFQTQLTRATKLFLESYIHRTPKPLNDMLPMAKHPRLTRLFREEVLVNMTPESEAKVFRVITMNLDGDEPDRVWLGVGVQMGEENYDSWMTVCMLAPSGEFYTRWDKHRPLRIIEEFESAEALWSAQVEHRLAARSELLERRLYSEAKLAMQEHQPDHGVDELTYHHVLHYLRQLPADQAAEKSPAILDPTATRELRLRFAPLVGPNVWQFRVFQLPRIQGRPWFGVTEGERAMCLLTPDGDFIARWDLEVFYDLRNIRRQFERLDNAHSRLVTSLAKSHHNADTVVFIDEALRQDMQRERSEQFLRHYVNMGIDSDLTRRYRTYLAEVSNPDRLEDLQVRVLKTENSARWLAIYHQRSPLHLMSPLGSFFSDESGRLRDLIGAVPERAIDQLTVALAPEQDDATQR